MCVCVGFVFVSGYKFVCRPISLTVRKSSANRAMKVLTKYRWTAILELINVILQI